MSFDRWRYHCERIENLHRLLVPPLRKKDLPEHLQALRLRRGKLIGDEVPPRPLQQQFGIGRGG